MPDFPSPASPTPLLINTFMKYTCGFESRFVASSTTPSGGTTWIANLVQYIPISLPFPYPLKRFFWLNGSVNTTTNVDCGIYTVGGAKLASTGSTVMGTVSAWQYAAPTTTMILVPGMYYLAWTCDNTTTRANCVASTAVQGELTGLLQETTGAFGLPATMTPVAWAQAFGTQACGITRTTSGF